MTSFLGDDHIMNIGRKQFIQLEGILVQNTNPFYFTINEDMYVYIYYEKIHEMLGYESLKNPYPVEVLDCFVDVSTSETFVG